MIKKIFLIKIKILSLQPIAFISITEIGINYQDKMMILVKEHARQPGRSNIFLSLKQPEVRHFKWKK